MFSCPRCASPCEESHKFCFSCGGELGDAIKRAEDDPLVGVTLPGGYRLKNLVGVGGMGRVYCADQVALGTTLAGKVGHSHLSHDDIRSRGSLKQPLPADLP